MNEKIYVFAARYPFFVERGEVLPAERAEDIASCTDEKIRAQKYYVWKLFERALNAVYGVDIGTVPITHETCGRWKAEGVEFSLTHSGDIVAVVLSSVPVGIDVELCDKERFSGAFAKKILTSKEKKKIGKRTDISGICNLLWTKKEAIFKTKGASVFRPKKIDSASLPTKTVKLEAGGKEYYLSVAASDMGQVYIETTNVTAGDC